MIHTNHSVTRKSQRGIRDYHISLLFQNGSFTPAPGGATKVTLTRKDAQAAISERKREIQDISKLAGLTAIIDGEVILTIYKKHW
jgi:hypothetical protein